MSEQSQITKTKYRNPDVHAQRVNENSKVQTQYASVVTIGIVNSSPEVNEHANSLQFAEVNECWEE